MKIIDPCVDPRLVPEGSKAFVIAEHHQEYQALPSIQTPAGQVITRWELTLEERRAIVEGADVFVTLLSGGSINPFFVTIGPVNWRENER